MRHRAYIASGWFSPEQEKARQDVLRACDDSGLLRYSPREDFLYVPGVTPSIDVFRTNIEQIFGCSFMIASTEGKDMGTLFECGVAFSHHIPIVYYYLGSGKFNLMLSESAAVVCTSYEELLGVLSFIQANGQIPRILYTGEKE